MECPRSVLRYLIRSAILILSICPLGLAIQTMDSFDPLFDSTAVADLDGDQKPDIVQTSELGRVPDGYLYRVELLLSSGAALRTFTFKYTDDLGIRIIPVDIDGDHDVDLAIAGRFLGQAVGVWINDGAGTFDKISYPKYSIPVSRDWISQQPDLSDQAVCRGARESAVALTPSRLHLRGPKRPGRTTRDDLAGLTAASQHSSPRLRAPPK